MTITDWKYWEVTTELISEAIFIGVLIGISILIKLEIQFYPSLWVQSFVILVKDIITAYLAVTLLVNGAFKITRKVWE